MGMDLDFIAAEAKIDELLEFFSDIDHGERGKMADEIIETIEKLIQKYKK